MRRAVSLKRAALLKTSPPRRLGYWAEAFEPGATAGY
jgi:hypothetical protein